MAIERPFGRYVLEERIALGGMAEIFRARTATEGFDKKVCIKRVLPHYLESPEFVTMFRDEARLAARLQHANVVQMFDFGEEDGSLYLAMELVDGADLKKLNDRAVRTGRRWSVGQALQIGIEMARGLHHAHALTGDDGPLHIVHRDISPHNVLISRAGEVKVTDFGIAMAAQRASHTSTGVVKGKLSYMAPEQADGSPVDHRADQFATALVVWETLCGKKCFDGDNEAQVLRKVLTCEVPRPSVVRGDVPSDVDDVLLQALAPTPDGRYEDMRAFERALTRASFELGDDPSFSDLRPLVAVLLDDGANMRKTAVLEQAPAIAPPAAGEASAVFTTDSKAKRALEQAGLAASGELETVMADATLVADAPFEEAISVELGDSTDPTKTIVPASLAEDAAPPSVDATIADDHGAAVALPRRMDPESVIPTEPVRRAPGGELVTASPVAAAGAGPRPAVPLLAGVGITLVLLIGAGVKVAADEPAAVPAAAQVTPGADAAGLPPDDAPTEQAPSDDGPAPTAAKDADERVADEAGEQAPASPAPLAIEGASAAPTATRARRRRGRPAVAARPAGEGKVFVNVLGSWAHVFKGRKKLGTTPVTLTLPTGTQRLRLENPETGRSRTVKATVVAGETSKIVERW